MKTIANNLLWFLRCFLAAFFVMVGLQLGDLLIEDPSMTIVICENGAGACDRIREPMKTNWVF